jgi:hypothetical protein
MRRTDPSISGAIQLFVFDEDNNSIKHLNKLTLKLSRGLGVLGATYQFPDRRFSNRYPPVLESSIPAKRYWRDGQKINTQM